MNRVLAICVATFVLWAPLANAQAQPLVPFPGVLSAPAGSGGGGGGGTVTGTGAVNQIAVWTSAINITGFAALTYDGTTFTTTAAISQGGAKFTVTNAGNITKINNVVTSFPAVQGGVASCLQNNGAGVLTWVTCATMTVPGGSDTQLQFNDASAFGGAVGFTHNKTTKTMTFAPTTPTEHVFTITAGTLATTKKMNNFSATVPATAATEIGTLNDITTTAGSTGAVYGSLNRLLAGTVGNASASIFTNYNVNTVEGVGTLDPSNGVSLGTSGFTTAVAGANVPAGAHAGTALGLYGLSRMSTTISAGFAGFNDFVQSGATAYGVIGTVNRTDDGSSGLGKRIGSAAFALDGATNIAGAFGLQAAAPAWGTGAFTTVGLLAMNGTVAGDIFRAVDNVTTVFTIADGGDSTFVADVAINGGDLTSTAATFNLLNATVTTLNIGGAATTMSIGKDSTTATALKGTVTGSASTSGTMAAWLVPTGIATTIPTKPTPLAGMVIYVDDTNDGLDSAVCAAVCDDAAVCTWKLIYNPIVDCI